MKGKERNINFFYLWKIFLFSIFGLLITNVLVIANEPWGIYIERQENATGQVPCKICGRTLKLGHVHVNAEIIMKNHLKNNLVDMGINFIDEKGPGKFIHVLIYRFIERRGGNFAVEKPASVGFHIHLFDKDNILRKVYIFDETQQALSENVLTIGKFLRRRARWVTASELAEEGLYNGLMELKEELK